MRSFVAGIAFLALLTSADAALGGEWRCFEPRFEVPIPALESGAYVFADILGEDVQEAEADSPLLAPDQDAGGLPDCRTVEGEWIASEAETGKTPVLPVQPVLLMDGFAEATEGAFFSPAYSKTLSMMIDEIVSGMDLAQAIHVPDGGIVSAPEGIPGEIVDGNRTLELF